MAASRYPGRRPALFLLAGLLAVPASAALGQETVYIGGTGEQVEINLDVLEALGTPPNVAGLLRADIRRGQVQDGMPLPLPGEVRHSVTRGAPMPPPSRPPQMTRRLTAAQPATAIAPVAPRPPAAALPTARRIAPQPSAPTRTAAVPAPARVTAPVPSAPKVAATPAPTVAAPAKVAIPAPTPSAPQTGTRTATTIPAIKVPAPPAATSTRTAAIAPPPPPPAVNAEAPKAAPAAKAPEPARQVASAPAAPKAPAPAASANSAAISVVFEADSKTLPGNASGTLGTIAAKMKANGELRVELKAYATSGDRSEAKARRLSLSRALEVRSFLIREGIASTRMDVRALGDRAPGAPGDRVDLTLVER
ncbi:OmpA family protein [Nisaea sediminum]|uniref:OmpA family protein n=1 Tax=Nisaea sediminum TaxID=2775867 RepID=UPI001868D3FD|nr:OmpA family protein [Nisaea sediminum]